MEKFKELLLRVSYFNAAEGSNWARERKARIEATEELRAEYRRLKDLGQDPIKVLNEGKYLVTSYDLEGRYL